MRGPAGTGWTFPARGIGKAVHDGAQRRGTVDAKRVYLAARYGRHPEMRQVRDELIARGYVVTSRWIDQHDGALPDSLDSAALNGEPARAGRFAQVDVDDLAAADTVVSFTSAAVGGKGDRHVEFGIALGLGKHLVVIGPRENVFHTLPAVEQHDSFTAFLAALDGASPGVAA